MQTMVATAAGPPPGVEPSEPSDVLPAGAKAGPWIVERELGRGGMGAVYGVLHEEIGKRAALKVMHRRLTIGSSGERILLEAKVVNQVGHPNIVDIFETGQLPDGRPYIVMERLEGVALSERAEDGKILPDQVIAILLEVCDALIAAHAAGVVHRDLKLDNVFLIDNPDDPQQPRIKLLDWGIAKVIRNDPHNTIEGQLVGTPQYLAPEQARGAAVTPMTDVYSLGVMAYELFLEQLPFEAETSAEIMAMHLRAEPPPPSDAWPDIPVALETLLLAMLAKDPEARPSMLTVAHTLEMVRAELDRRRTQIAPECQRWPSAPGLAMTEPAMWRTGARRWQFVVGACALAASATMFAISHVHDSAAAPPRTAPEAIPVPAEIVVKETAVAKETKVEAGTPTPAPTPAPAPKKRIAHHGANRVVTKAPVTPHRGTLIDPDGTVDPYQ